MKLEQIRKVSIYDFDGTLIKTPEPELGKKIWKEKTGEDYPHKGWWGKRESLDIDIFEHEPFADIVSARPRLPHRFWQRPPGSSSPQAARHWAFLRNRSCRRWGWRGRKSFEAGPYP